MCGVKVTEMELKVVSVIVDVTLIKAHRIVGMMHAAYYTLVVARGSRLRR